MVGDGGRERRKGHRHRRCSRTSTCTTCSTCGPTSGGGGTRAGDVVIVRFADDYVVGFEHREDASGSLPSFAERLAKFGLELAAEKTRLIEFGRFAAERRQKRGLGKPETFQFLGLHAHMREIQDRTVSAQADHRPKAGASEAAQGEDRVSATQAPAHPRTGPMARQRGSRTPQLLRRARQHQGGQRLPPPGDLALVPSTSVPQPAHSPGMEANVAPCRSMAPARSDQASLAFPAPRRSYPNQEPSAVVPHAGSTRDMISSSGVRVPCGG